MSALAWVAGAALVLLAALGLAMAMRATTDTEARDAARRDRDELARRESLRVVLDEHTRGSGNTVPTTLAAAVPDYRDAMSRARRQDGAS